jgi:hypothetical protein
VDECVAQPDPAQGTVIGGAFVVLAAIIAFGTGSLNRRAEDKRFHYTELKALYSEALLVTSQMAVMGEHEREVRRQLVPAITELMVKVTTELYLSGEYKTANLLAAYMNQRISSGAVSSAFAKAKVDQALGAEPTGPELSADEMAALAEFFEIEKTFKWAGQKKIDTDDVLQHCREELAHYTPVGSKHWRALRRDIKSRKKENNSARAN